MASGERRPTPADPMPAVTTEDEAPSAVVRNLPPELGPDAVALLEGLTFMYSDAVGNVAGGSIGGLVHADTRYLSTWVLTLNGAPLLVLDSGTVDANSAAFFLTNSVLPDLPANSVGVRRQRFINGGMSERIDLQAFADRPLPIELRLAVGTDFADIFEIKEQVRDRSAQITRSHAPDGSRLCFAYRNHTFSAETLVTADPPATEVDGDDLVWRFQLPPNQTWCCQLHIPVEIGEDEIRPGLREFATVFAAEGYDPLVRWQGMFPRYLADSDLLINSIEKSYLDIVALTVEKRVDGQPVFAPTAGMPWYLTLFGRDMLISGFQSVAVAQQPSSGILLLLASMQGTRVDDFRDEEPGKIMHEIRQGELTQLGIKPHRPYYGTTDATQLWLILLSEHWRWTRDDEFVRTLRDNAYAALRWIDEYGDSDRDGYVEYATRSPHGLGNQCWRDSWDGIHFSDGSIPVLPIATCETQGYTYDAKLRLAELADGPFGDPHLAQRLRAEADDLYERFNRDFWTDDRGGFYVVGLDGDKAQINSMTSNMGHLFWSGIVPPERAAIVARQLMSDQLFSGWGVRTTSAQERAFNPIGYHRGTVWPHDNSIIAYGLARYGFRQEANRIVMAMLHAAKYSDHRLPEAFAGYDRSFARRPVPYPTACSPQAWATLAPAFFVRSILGLEARDGQITIDPDIPPEIGRLRIAGVNAFGRRWEIEAVGTRGSVHLLPEDVRLAPEPPQ